MDAKVKQSRIVSNEMMKKKAAGYLKGLKEELKKITWTTKLELQFFTKVVVGSIFVFGIGIYFIDLVVKGCLDTIKGIVHWIF